jgi:hypothetical protein
MRASLWGSGLALWLLCAAWSAHAQARWPDLSRPGERQGGGEQDAAVLVGVRDYWEVPDVEGADENALAWSSYLHYMRGVPLGKIALLRNKDATREKIEAALSSALQQVGPEGTLWFVFVGHGAPSVDGRGGILIGSDAQQSARSLYARGVSREAVLEAISRGPQRRAVVVLDTCFSGRTGEGAPLAVGLQPLIPAREGLPAGAGVTVFTAGSGEQFAGPLPGAGRPAFSYLLLGALRGWADQDHDKAVTEREAQEYTQSALMFLLKGDREQTPELWSASPERALAAASSLEPGPDLFALATAGAPGSPSLTDAVGGGGAWGWVMIGLGAGVAGFGGYSSWAVSARNQEALALSQAAEPRLAEYERLKDEAALFDVLQYVGYGVGGALALGGALILALDGPAPDAQALRLTPLWGADAGVNLQMEW